MKSVFAALALIFAAASPAAAILPALPEPAPSEAAATASPASTIDNTQRAGDDERIAARIRGILGELPAFGDVDVAVSQGVVRLSGTVPAQDDIARAEAIAGRVAGVVTAESSLERDVSLAAQAGGIGALRAKLDGLVAMLPLLALALAVWAVIAAFGYLVARLATLWGKLAPNSFLKDLIASAIRFVFIVGGLVVALDILGASALLGAVLGGAGVVGLALGFALRDTIENYVASLMLSLRQPFRANDWVRIDDLEGRVIRLTSRATILMSLDGNHLRIPNGQVFRAVITNFTRNPQRRFQFDLGVDADDDALAASRLGRETLAGLPFVLDQPPTEGRIVEVGDSNVVIRFLGWIDQTQTDWWKAQSRAIPAVKQALETAGFGMPEPIYRLRFDPRSASVPLVDPHGESPSPERRADARAKSTPAPTAPADHEDVRPADEIERMVASERMTGGGGGQEKDLLDHARPVE